MDPIENGIFVQNAKLRGYGFLKFQDPYAEFGRKCLIGFTAGTLACCVNIPFDVAKSRIQGPQPEPGKIKYKGTMRSILMVYKEEG